jgi:prepilin-type N-terminal cleavage/methylation domain-containing protein
MDMVKVRTLPLPAPMSPSHPTRLQPAFTLIELLVTIAIIGVLATLIIGGVGRSRQRANESKCVANLRQLVLGWQLYGNDNGGVPVPISGSTIASDPERRYAGWISRLLPYLGAGNIDELLKCPAAPRPSSTGSQGTASTAWRWSNGSREFSSGYGLNARWYGDSETFAPGDENFFKRLMNAEVNGGPVFSDATWIDFQRSSPPADFQKGSGCAMVRHGGKGVHMAFAPGNVRLVTMGELYSVLRLRPVETMNPGWIEKVPHEYR